MRIAFIDTSGWNYDATTPYDEPMGGSQSALCYLAVELAKLGHAVYVFTGDAAASISQEVAFWPKAEAEEPGVLNTFDVVIVLSVAVGRVLRDKLGVTVPLILWNHHNVNQGAIRDLANPEEQAAWNAIVFVSAAQRDTYHYLRKTPHIMHNCVSPAFEQVALPPPWFETGEPPVLFYTSTPFRGLDVLLEAFPTIRQAIPGTRLKVFSSMAVYRGDDAPFSELYDKAARMPGVWYMGSVGQRELAQRLAGCAALAHPSTFPECHSIAVLEAMAVGADVYTTDLGGQRETTGNLASLIPAHGDKPRLAAEFAGMAIGALNLARRNPVLAAMGRDARLDFVRHHHLWRDRAKGWSNWLESVKR